MIDFSRFQCPDNTGHSKVMSLEQAIAENVKPGMSLHLCVGQANANAAICEIARQFWGSKPDFTVYSMLFYQHGISLVYGKLVKKLVAAFIGDSYPGGSPNAVIRKAYAQKEIEIESWSILTYVERFMAGAMGLPFMPTNSLLQSGMAEHNKGSFMEIDDPFGSGSRLGLVSAANPDLTLMHAHAADSYGNLIGTGPGAEAQWGALASKNGVVATVEKIVSSEFVRQHSHRVIVPGYLVKAVAVAPYGSHPRGITNQGAPELATYFDDFDYLLELRDAYKTDETAGDWVNKWILGCKTHDDYLAKLGPERLRYLNSRAEPEAWRSAIRLISEDQILATSHKPSEMMVVQAAREIHDRVIRNDLRVILAGVGVSNIAAWLANQLLCRKQYPVELVAEFGFFGYCPPPGDPSIHKIDNLHTAKMMTDSLQILGIHAAGTNNKCIGVLGAAQIDKYGNINSTMDPGKTYFVGSGGANDVASGSREVVVVVAQDKRRLIERVPFITCPGTRVKTLITDMGVFEKLGTDDEFTLTKVLPASDGATPKERVKRAKDNCGWELKIAPQIEECAPPEPDSLSTIRLFDPHGYFIG
ncbi:MAG: CoA-transferase [Dehalococcoidia bacterium]